MQLIYHPDKTFSKADTTALKYLSINFTNWYCPIHEHLWLFRHDGTIKSGACGQNMLYHTTRPFWEGKNERPIDDICKFRQNACSCGGDLNSPKAITKEIYDEFFEAAQKVDYNEVPDYDGKEIIATGAQWKIINAITEIHIDVGKKCNFDCSYCPPTIHDNFSPFLSLKKINQGLRILDRWCANRKKRIIITGGEPTLYKDLDKLIILAKSRGGYQIGINSNGTASYSTYDKLLQDPMIRIDITFHCEFTTKKIIEKCTKLKNKFPNTLQLKMLSHSEEFVDLVNQHTTDYVRIPIYDKSTAKRKIIEL